MKRNPTVGRSLEAISAQSPAGFAIGLHVKFSTPKYLFQSYDREWIEIYSRMGLVLRDPTVRWGFTNSGTIRWSSLAAEDLDGVLMLAAEHGLKYGFTSGIHADDSLTIASFARPDREFTDAEMEDIAGHVLDLHRETLGTEALSPEDHEALKHMSVMLTHS
jgi:LuxR family transcriptional regulator